MAKKQEPSQHRMPQGLIKGGRGQRLWHDITGTWELSEAEYRTLESACFTADRLGRIRRALGDELTTTGSQGQLVVHPLLPELRRDETHLADLLKRLDLPMPDENTGTATAGDDAGQRSAMMRATVNQRWHGSRWGQAYG